MEEEKEVDSLKDSTVQFTWGFGWPVPNEIVKLLNAMLDPTNKRLVVERIESLQAKKASEGQDEEGEEEDYEVSEQSSLPSHHESAESCDNLIDVDYSPDQGLLPY